MHEIVFALPVRPGKEDLDRRILDEMLQTRRADYDEARRAAGITRQAVWHQQTPDGTLAIVYATVEDPEAMQQFTSSDAAFNTWFRTNMLDVHGVDISAPLPPIHKVHDTDGAPGR